MFKLADLLEQEFVEDKLESVEILDHMLPENTAMCITGPDKSNRNSKPYVSTRNLETDEETFCYYITFGVYFELKLIFESVGE